MGEILNNLRKHCHVISDVKIWKQKIISGNNNINREKDIILIPNKKKEKKKGEKKATDTYQNRIRKISQWSKSITAHKRRKNKEKKKT